MLFFQEIGKTQAKQRAIASPMQEEEVVPMAEMKSDVPSVDTHDENLLPHGGLLAWPMASWQVDV